MATIDEQSRRLPGFKEGTPVEGADGQQWQLPRPVVIFDIDDTETGFTTRMQLGDDDTTLSDLVKAWRKATSDEGVGDDWVLAELKIRSYLVKQNYDLTPAETNAVLPLVLDDESPLARIRVDVLRVARGLGPKP